MTFVAGVVLAAGSSRRLGSPKQVLTYRDSTLLGASVDVARACGFGQLIVTLGGAADRVRAAVALDGVDVVVVDDFGSGCSSSLRSAVPRVDPRADGIVLLLGDQPGIRPASVASLVDACATVDVGVCQYRDGAGHPFWLSRRVFGELAELHGDKGVWKLIDARGERVRRMPVSGDVPLDVDTWEDYERLLAETSRVPG